MNEFQRVTHEENGTTAGRTPAGEFFSGVMVVLTMMFWTVWAVLPIDLCWSSTAGVVGLKSGLG
jgi:hypothetical protein